MAKISETNLLIGVCQKEDGASMRTFLLCILYYFHIDSSDKINYEVFVVTIVSNWVGMG